MPIVRRLLASLALLALAASLLHAQAVDTLLPIQRIVVKPERAAKELENPPPGGLIVWPLAQFETRLEQARKRLQGREQVPALTRAAYSAELVGRSLANGRGQWTVQQNGGTGLLPIEPFNLALQQLTWEQGSPALLAGFDGKTLGLLVKHTGAQVCFFDWSARGVPSDDGISFTLEVPPCALNTFELKLPADQWLFVPKTVGIVTGPHATDSPDHKLWKVQATGQTSIKLAMRKLTPKGSAPTIFAHTRTTQIIAPDRIGVDYDFQIDILHGSVQRLEFETDAALQPFEVVLKSAEIKTWRWDENVPRPDPKNKLLSSTVGVLTIEFNHPVQGRIPDLRIKCHAPRPGVKPWTSPGLQVREAKQRGEVLLVHFLPNAYATRWDPGTFQHLDIKTEDGAQILTLADTALTPAASRRPTLTLDRLAVDVHTVERTVWHIAPRDATLKTEIDYAVTHGQLFELAVQLPKTGLNYQIESLSLQPADALKEWHPTADTLIVELKQALVPGKKATLTVQMRALVPSIKGSAVNAEPVARTLACPDLEPKNVAKREGSVAITIDPRLHGQLLTSSLSPTSLDPLVRNPSVPTPSFFFVLRNQRLNASVRVVPERARLQWRGKHHAALREAGGRVRFRWEIEPIAGAADYFDLRLAPNFPSNWKVVAEEGGVRPHHWERLPLRAALPHFLRLGAANGFQAAVLESALPVGSQWRFYLSEPLRTRATFTIEAPLSAGLLNEDWQRLSLWMPNAQAWDIVAGGLGASTLPRLDRVRVWPVPLVLPVQGSSDEEITLESPLEPIERAAPVGRLAAKGKVVQELTMKLDAALPYPGLIVATRSEQRAASALERCDPASVETQVHRDGRILHRLDFRLWGWRERTCALKLPAGFEIVAASVEGQSLDRLDVRKEGDVVRLVLAIDQNADSVRCAVVVRAPASSAFVLGLARIDLPRIDWPAPPLTMRHRVLLEKGLTPLDLDNFTPVGTPLALAHPSATVRAANQVWHWGSAWLPFSDPMQERLDEQKQTVLAKESAFRAAHPKPVKLADALERFTFDHLKEQTPLLVDRAALRELNLTRESAVPAAAFQSGRPFWETLGLTYLPRPGGALLTSPARLQQLGVLDAGAAAAFDVALEEALLHGRDGTASFALVLDWLRSPMDVPAFGSSSSDAAGMTEWSVRTGEARSFFIMDPMPARLGGWVLAAVFALVLWRVQRRLAALHSVRLHLALATIATLVMIWLPINLRECFGWPTFVVELVACFISIAYVLLGPAPVIPGGQTTVTSPGMRAVGGSTAMILIMGVALGQPAAPRPFVVFITDAAKPSAILTPELIARFDEIDNLPLVGTHNVVLAAAKYTGKVADGFARFEAQYEIHSFKDQTSLLLPLTGVQLQEGVFLDGTPIFPTAQKTGYLIPIRDKGTHTLRLGFAARVNSVGDHADLRFTIPKLVRNELALEWPTPVQTVHLLHGNGAEEHLAGKGNTVKELRAQLGHEGTVHLRWTDTTAVAAGKGIDVDEAHFWDLRPGSLALTSSLYYGVGKSTLTQLRVTMPEGLHVRGVEALAAQLPAAAPVLIKGWQVLDKGAQRRLVVDFAQPVSGNIVLNLDIFPQLGPRESQLLLALPAPQQGNSKAGLIGYRLDTLEVRSTEVNLSVQGISAADFEQLWKKQVSRPIPAASRAYKYRRKEQQAGLRLAIQPEARQAALHLDGAVDLHHADLRGKFTISSSFDDLMFLEFSVDGPLTLVDVVGPDVARWTSFEKMVQVWLRAPRKKVELELVGWQSLPYKTGAAKTPFRLPAIRCLSAPTTSATLQLRPGVGVDVDIEQQGRIKPFAAKKQPADGLFNAVFWLHPEKRQPTAALFTKVQPAEGALDLWQRIRLTAERGTLPPLKLHVKNGLGDHVAPDAPGAVVQRLKDAGPKHAVWSIKYPSGMPQEVFITLHDHTVGDRQPHFVLPTVELEGLPFRTSEIAWKDVDVTDAGKKLNHQKGVKDQIVMLREEGRFADQPGWAYADRPPVVKVVMPKPTERSNARVLSATEDITRDDRRQWTHSLTLRLHAPDAVELKLRFPAEVAQLSVFDQQRLAPTRSQTASQAIVPIDASNRPREVRLHWRYVESAERADLPNLGEVQIEAVELPAHPRRLWTPPCTQVKSDVTATPTLLGRLLDEADTAVQISAVLSQEAAPPEEIGAAQQDVFAALRQADYLVGVLKSGEYALGEAQRRLKELRASNAALAKKHGYDRLRINAEKAKRQPIAVREAVSPAGIPWPVTQHPQLVPLRALDASATLISQSQWLLLAAVFLFVISYFRRGVATLRLIAPEIGSAAVVTLMLWQGWSIIGLAVIAAIVILRLASLPALLRRQPMDPAPEGPTVIQTTPPVSST